MIPTHLARHARHRRNCSVRPRRSPKRVDKLRGGATTRGEVPLRCRSTCGWPEFAERLLVRLVLTLRLREARQESHRGGDTDQARAPAPDSTPTRVRGRAPHTASARSAVVMAKPDPAPGEFTRRVRRARALQRPAPTWREPGPDLCQADLRRGVQPRGSYTDSDFDLDASNRVKLTCTNARAELSP